MKAITKRTCFFIIKELLSDRFTDYSKQANQKSNKKSATGNLRGRFVQTDLKGGKMCTWGPFLESLVTFRARNQIFTSKCKE